MEETEIEETPQPNEPLFKPLTDSCHQDGVKAPNPKYEDGKVLPKKVRNRFLQEAKAHFCVPLEEIDPYFRNKQTFIVIGRWGTIHRFSCNPEGYCNLEPNNVIRKLAIYLLTNWIFSTLIVATILLNVVALMKTQKYEVNYRLDDHTKQTWLVEAMYIVNYVCLAVYCVELAVKVLARGFIGGDFSCFRDPWIWLDVIVIWTGFFPYYTLILNRRSILWLRLFKIIPLIPSIRQAGKLSVKAVKRLGGMLTLLVLFLWFFAVVGLEVYMGTLTQKCIKEPAGQTRAMSDEHWARYFSNRSNWYHDDVPDRYTNDNMEGFDIVLCGNASGARMCPEKYVCMQGYGKNPDHGYTNFDNLFWSLLSVIRIASEDFTEEIFRQIISTNGPWHVIFFEAIFFFVTFPMGCLFFGTLANFFSESKAPSDLEIEDLTGLAELHEFDGAQNPEALVIKGKSVDVPDEELAGFRKALHSFVIHDWVKYVLVCVILIDIFGIASDYYGIAGHSFDYWFKIIIIPYFVFFVYTVEFLLKIIALGPPKYFRDKWNYVDLIVLLTFFLEIQSYFGHYTGYMLAPIRLLKLIQYWPSLRMIFAIYYRTIKTLWGWVLYTAIIFAFLAFIGPFEIGSQELDGRRKVSSNDMPRWSYIDSWHSFRVIVRMQIGEWIETLWEVLPYGGFSTIVFYLVVNLCGALLLSFLLIGVVYSTIGELKSNYDPSKDRGLKLILRKSFNLIYSPIQRIQPREMIMKNGSGGDAAESGEDEAEKAKAEAKEKGGRRKKSIVAESTNQLRKVMQDCTEHIVYKIVCSSVIVIASIAMIFETHGTPDDVFTVLFIIEILFTIMFFVVVVYELLSFGFKESFVNRGWLFDALIVLENALNLIVYNFSPTGPFRLGMFCIRSFRPLMLISRFDWLKAPFRGLKYEVKTLWETVLAIWFLWLFFDTFAVHWLAGLFFKCIDPMTAEEVHPTLTKTACLSKNYTWENSELNFDNVGDGFLNMVFLVSRMGWVEIINDGSDATSHDAPRMKDGSKLWFMYFILFVLMGGLGALGILFSYVFQKFQEDKGYRLILTDGQFNTYKEMKNKRRPSQSWITLEEEYVPAPETPCVLSLYNFITNKKFEAFIVALIVFDNVCLSLDHYQMSQEFDTVVTVLRLVVLALFIVEMIVKLVAWGKHYFRNAWNYLDLIVVVTGVLGVIFSDLVEMYFISPVLLRMLRMLRIFRLFLSGKCGCQAAKILMSSVSNVRPALCNLILFQLTIMWAYALLGVYLWENVQSKAGLDDVINFRTFRSAFWTLALLLGFPCLDGLYKGLSNETDCQVKDPEITTCGDKGAAIVYIGSYAALTFLVLLNMYAALISEINFEIARFKHKSKPEEDVPLEDVATENGHQMPSNGESGEAEDEAGAKSEQEE